VTSKASTRPDRERGKLTGTHVLLMMLAFFGVVFTVNGIFLTKAIGTYTGVVSVEPYVKGLKYNDRIAAGDRQAALGWSERLDISRDGRIALVLADADSRPVRNLVVKGGIGRPSTSRLDRTVALTETTPGTYATDAGKLDDGTWLVFLEARPDKGEGEAVYRLRRRVWLKP
jgi:nitrogen fixation protein FixH